MEETINDRIEMLVNEHFDGNKAAFAKAIGLPPTGLSNYIGKARRSKPSVEMITKIITATGVDAYWLLFGSEAPGITAVNSAVATGSGTANNSVNITTGGDSAVLAERVRSLETLIIEKNERINELKERIEELKAK